MLWRSVVGKLWLTILLLVSVVLSVLLALLLRFFETYHVNEAQSSLMSHGNMIASIIEGYSEENSAFLTINNFAEIYGLEVVIIGNGDTWYSNNEANLAHISVETFYKDPVLSKVFNGDSHVVSQGDYPFYKGGKEVQTEVMIVGVPVNFSEIEKGAAFIYQPLSAIKETAVETKRIIYLSAGVALVLTTIFAFFLSSRITAPLSKMRLAANEVTEGRFGTKIPILTSDEIGQLSIAFNRMGRELNRYITELNQEKEQLSRILTSMADGVITLDRKGTIMVTNPPADRFIQAWLYEQGIDYAEHADLPKEMKQLFEQVVALESEQLVEIDIQGRSFTISMTPLYDYAVIRGAVAVIRDMTEERQHDKLRKDFIANVSHELRTPISMLQGYSEAIVDDIAGSDEEKKEIAQIIYEESLRMGRLVNELLDLARLEAGHFQLHKETLEVASFVEKVVRKFQGLARDEGIDLKLEIAKNLNPIYVDPDRLEQVLTNLIHNAIRHTPKQGFVKINIKPYLTGIRFDIEDNGSGIPEEDIPFVFERFYKADKARTRGRSGTGLGLSIVKNIIEAHNGQISVRSKLNEGTTFTFFLPNGKEK